MSDRLYAISRSSFGIANAHAILLILLALSAPGELLADTITNIMSPVASYQYPQDLGSDTITNAVSAIVSYQYPQDINSTTLSDVMSLVVSYQYVEDYSSEALTNGGIISPIVGYQFLEWPSNNVLQLLSGLPVSYYYQYGTEPPLLLSPTNRTPTTAETVQAVQPPGTSPTQLVTFVNGAFTTNAPSPSKMTVVLTHGWNDSPNGWPKGMAQSIANNMASQPNIVAWDWTEAAASPVYNPGGPANNAGPQGRALGQALQDTLGTNYALPIHFIGHSLGTLVNAAAVNYVHRESWAAEDLSPIQSWTNLPVHVTLFDEAEIATGVGPLKIAVDVFQVLSGSGNFLSPKRYNWHPLPKTFVWADNYITAFGLPHEQAVNVILTNGIPSQGLDFSDWLSAVYAFHGYPINWYDETINNSGASILGWRWSFEQGGWFGQAPPTNTVFMQSSGGSPWSLAQVSWDVATNWLDSRVLHYQSSLWSTIPATAGQAVNNAMTGFGTVQADQLLVGPSDAYDTIIKLQTASGSSPNNQNTVSRGVSADTGGETTTNVPAYVWFSMFVPTNAVTMSFDFKLLGDGASDSFVAAVNGTNVLSLAANLIETNLLMNSGQIDVSTLAGQDTELFFGIVGSTSTNAQITVQDILFYTLQANLVDSVGDGIPDIWRAQYFPNILSSTTNGQSCATCDADGTGQNNLFKYVAGLDPTNPASVFALQITAVTNQPHSMSLNFNPLALGRTYTPLFTTNLVNGVWLPLTTYVGPMTNGNQSTVTDTNPIPPQEFYRIHISLP